MNSKPSVIHRAVIHPYFVLLLRFFAGGIMIYAGWTKLIDMPGMADSIENYRIVPRFLVNLPAIVLPAVEVVAGVFLIVGIWMEGALFIITSLFVVFIIAVESAIWRGLNIECGCFGLSDSEIVGVKVLIRDALFLLATVPIWIRHYSASENKAREIPVDEAESSPDV